MRSKKFTVAVCGGGVGGLTCALILSKCSDIDVDIYEAASQLAEIGAGIGIWPRTWALLEKLGLDQDLAKVTAHPPTHDRVVSFSFRKGDEPEGLSFYDLITKGRLLTVHRADFQGVLLKHISGSCQIHYSKRLRSYSQAVLGPIDLSFEDGTSAACDVLIGADGLKSSVRSGLLQEQAAVARSLGHHKKERELLEAIEPSWSGSVAYRVVVPADRLKAKAPDHRVLNSHSMYFGKDAHIVAYPISSGRMINVAAFHTKHELENTKFDGPWVKDAVDDEIRPLYANWEPEVQQLIECVEKPLRWAVHVAKPLQSYVSGRVALLGDAAHAMSPNQGSGAGQSIEDGFVLATLLGHPLTTLDSVSRALQVYDDIRPPFANDIAVRSRQNGLYFDLEYGGPDFQNCTTEEKKTRLQELGSIVSERWEWAWTTTLDAALEEAVQKLENLA